MPEFLHVCRFSQYVVVEMNVFKSPKEEILYLYLNKDRWIVGVKGQFCYGKYWTKGREGGGVSVILII